MFGMEFSRSMLMPRKIAGNFVGQPVRVSFGHGESLAVELIRIEIQKGKKFNYHDRGCRPWMNFTADSISILTCIFHERHPGIRALVNYSWYFRYAFNYRKYFSYARSTLLSVSLQEIFFSVRNLPKCYGIRSNTGERTNLSFIWACLGILVYLLVWLQFCRLRDVDAFVLSITAVRDSIFFIEYSLRA